MTDNERIQAIKEFVNDMLGNFVVKDDVEFLLQQLEQRDKTIAELRKVMSDESVMWRSRELWKKSCEDAEKQNVCMLSALESIERGLFSTRNAQVVARDTIAQVKALTVSRQGETSDISVASEQP